MSQAEISAPVAVAAEEVGCPQVDGVGSDINDEQPSSTLDGLFANFANAEEVEPTQTSFDLLLQNMSRCSGDDDVEALFSRYSSQHQTEERSTSTTPFSSPGLQFYSCLQDLLLPQLSNPWQKLFAALDVCIAKCDGVLPAGEKKGGAVLICGAGPCGLRAGIEAALCRQNVTIVEKRLKASRANILTLWEETREDLLALGVGYLYPGLAPGWIGTRELQLAFLKISLLLGVKVHFGHELAGLCPPPPVEVDDKFGGEQNRVWRGRIKKHTPPAKKGETIALQNEDSHEQDAAQTATSFKQDKTAGYTTAGTGKCNSTEEAEVNPEFLGMRGFVEVDQALQKEEAGERVLPFHGLVIAEGEWSKSTRKLGFRKTIDTFNRSIGLIINMKVSGLLTDSLDAR
jgi:hypothetical protein